ncbi:hypothetical protein ACROYT_G019133 [Oculina patagonica]
MDGLNNDDESMRKTTSCKKTSESPGRSSSLIGHKNIFVANQEERVQTLLELVRCLCLYAYVSSKTCLKHRYAKRARVIFSIYGVAWGNEKQLQTTADSSTTQLEESQTGVADDVPVSTPYQMPCSSTASSSTQATSMTSQPSHSFKFLLSAKECEDLIALDEDGCATAHGLFNKLKEGKFLGVLFILKDVLPVLSHLLKAFQGGSVAFSQVAPVLGRSFTIYTSPLLDVIQDFLPSVHCYADDTQLYISFSPADETGHSDAIAAIERCIQVIRSWMHDNKLLLNEDKTEFFLIGTKQQLAKVNISHITVGSANIAPQSPV